MIYFCYEAILFLLLYTIHLPCIHYIYGFCIDRRGFGSYYNMHEKQ